MLSWSLVFRYKCIKHDTLQLHLWYTNEGKSQRVNNSEIFIFLWRTFKALFLYDIYLNVILVLAGFSALGSPSVYRILSRDEDGQCTVSSTPKTKSVSQKPCTQQSGMCNALTSTMTNKGCERLIHLVLLRVCFYDYKDWSNWIMWFFTGIRCTARVQTLRVASCHDNTWE